MGYSTTGNLVSSVKDANPDSDRTPNWTTLSFNTNTPTGTDVKFQAAASDDVNGPFSYVGPDGTSATYFTTSGADLSEFNGHRYLRYKAFLSTTDSSVTPTVQEVTVCFEDLLTTTTTTLRSDVNPSEFGQQVTFTATVSPNNPGGSTPTGDVQFNIDGTDVGSPVTLVGGQATFQTNSLAVGDHPVSATYAGSRLYRSSSDSLSQGVDRSHSTTSLTSDANPADFGQDVTFTATVAPPGAGPPSGTVDFTDITTHTTLCPGVSLGRGDTAECSTSALGIGNHRIRANYSGDGSFRASGDLVTETIRRVATSVTLRGSPQPSVHGQAVQLTAQVSFSPPAPGTPTGTVTFRRLGTALCANVPIDGSGRAVCGPLTNLPTGPNRLTASFSGDGIFRPSTSPIYVLGVNPAATATAVSATPNPVSNGAMVTLRARVMTQAPGRGVPEGKIQFLIDDARVGSPVTLVNGRAALTITVSLRPGRHGLRAAFVGTGDFVASSSGTWPLTVQ